MITAQIVSPWTVKNGPIGEERYPTVKDDYTLEQSKLAAPTPTVGSFANPAKPGDLQPVQQLNDTIAPVVIRCSYEVWEAIINDPDYGMESVYWYQEDGKQKRVISSAPPKSIPKPAMKAAPPTKRALQKKRKSKPKAKLIPKKRKG